MKTSEAEVIREYVPIDDQQIHGVTFDGKLVWFARNDEIVAFDPATEKVVQRHRVPSARAGTAFDGLYYVNAVTHNFKRGEYKQHFELTRNGLVSTVSSVSA